MKVINCRISTDFHFHSLRWRDFLTISLTWLVVRRIAVWSLCLLSLPLWWTRSGVWGGGWLQWWQAVAVSWSHIFSVTFSFVVWSSRPWVGNSRLSLWVVKEGWCVMKEEQRSAIKAVLEVHSCQLCWSWYEQFNKSLLLCCTVCSVHFWPPLLSCDHAMGVTMQWVWPCSGCDHAMGVTMQR